MTSVEPPGVKGTTYEIGLAGQPGVATSAASVRSGQVAEIAVRPSARPPSALRRVK